MKGILADINVRGHVEYLIELMQAEPWSEFWQELGLIYQRFEDVGLSPTASDLEIWQRCQAEELILITDNRNADSPESPVFTIADVRKFAASQSYAEAVLIRLYEYLLRIDSVRGTGRLYLP